MKKHVNEIHWLRCFACLAVVGIHVIPASILLQGDGSLGTTEKLMSVVQMALLFGTPTFIFITEFLLAKSYHKGVPKNFLWSRVKILLIPYIIMAIIYAAVSTPNLSSFGIQSLRNIFLGEFVAYFILIIFQFYILHMLFYKKLNSWSPKVVVPIALVINILYLSIFNFLPAPPNEFAEYVWSRGHWLPFLGWLFYFVLGYYSGKHYEALKLQLIKHKYKVLTLPFVLFSIVMILRLLGLPDVTSSKRIDIIFYTTSIIFLILYLSSKIKSTPRFVFIISKYSFSIYLTHKLIIDVFGKLSNNLVLHAFLLFFFTITISLILSRIINILPFGKYIVGRPGNIPMKDINKIKIGDTANEKPS